MPEGFGGWGSVNGHPGWVRWWRSLTSEQQHRRVGVFWIVVGLGSVAVTFAAGAGPDRLAYQVFVGALVVIAGIAILVRHRRR